MQIYPYINRPKVKPKPWGSYLEMQRAIMANCENIYGINSANLLMAIPFWEGSGNLVREFSINKGHATTFTGAPAWQGQGLYFSGSDCHVEGVGPAINDKSFSIITETRKINIADGYSCIFQTGTGSNRYGIWTNTAKLVAVSDSYNVTSADYVIAGQKQQLGLVHVFGVHNKFYVDGIYKEATSNLTGPTVANPTAYRLGNPPDSLSYDYGGTVYSFNLFDTILTDEQMNLFYNNPWGLYQETPKPIYFFIDSGTPPLTTIPVFIHHQNQMRA